MCILVDFVKPYQFRIFEEIFAFQIHKFQDSIPVQMYTCQDRQMEALSHLFPLGTQ